LDRPTENQNGLSERETNPHKKWEKDSFLGR